MMAWLSNYNTQLHPTPLSVYILMHALMIVPLEAMACLGYNTCAFLAQGPKQSPKKPFHISV